MISYVILSVLWIDNLFFFRVITVAKNCSVDQEALRREQQLAFDASGENIILGSLEETGVDLPQLKQLSAEDDGVLATYTDGLTAEVFHLKWNSREWNLKKKRPESLVKNIDGQTSFLNEVQRRRDFARLKINAARNNDSEAQRALGRLADTQFASYREGVMLSPWIAGEPLHDFNEQILQQIFATIIQLELSGFLEWDLCPGNILWDGKQIGLFDFGYCYPFDPLQHFNSNGLKSPMFHSVERLETRNFFGFLLRQEVHGSDRAVLSLFNLEKRLAVEAYQHKYVELKNRGATETVLTWLQQIIDRWQQAVSGTSSLEQLYMLESYRSHVLDIHDDISGRSCTSLTLQRIDKVIMIVQESYDMLVRNDGLFFGDEDLTRKALLAKLAAQREQAQRYQL